MTTEPNREIQTQFERQHQCDVSLVFIFSKILKMGPKIDPIVYHRVKALCDAKLSHKSIIQQLKNKKITVSRSTIHRINKSIGKRNEAAEMGLPQPANAYPRKVRKPTLIRKIAREAAKENPPTQNQLAMKHKVSQRTIGRIIHEDLQKKTYKKTKVHALKPRHKQIRKSTSRKLYRGHLAGKKSEFAVTLDEALFFTQDCNGTRRICYSKSKIEVEKYICERSEKFSDKVMVVGAMSGRGPLPLIRVPHNVKICAKYYIEEVLRPLLEKEIPKLYGEDTSKVFVHHDAASSHTANITTQYAVELKQKLGITIIPKQEIPVKSPDASPMDFYGFGMLKQALFKRRATTLNGLCKVLDDEWSKVTPEMCLKVFESWKRRLRAISENHGEHVENTQKIHRRVLRPLN